MTGPAHPEVTEWMTASNGVRCRINYSLAAKKGTPAYEASLRETQRMVEKILTGWAERNMKGEEHEGLQRL